MEELTQNLSKTAAGLQEEGRFVEALDTLNRMLRLDAEDREADQYLRQLYQIMKGKWIHHQITHEEKIPEDIYDEGLHLLKKTYTNLTEVDKKYVRFVAGFLSGNLSLDNLKDTWIEIRRLKQEEIKRQQENRKATLPKETRQPESTKSQPKRDPVVARSEEGTSGAGQQLDIEAEQQLTTKVFISYSHDSEDHRNRVLNLSNRLVREGVDCDIDRYFEDSPPPEGWPQWMRREIKEAKFVLVVCTETYRKRFEGYEEAGKGKGAKWEGTIITQDIYDREGKNLKFIPVFFAPEDLEHIPDVLRSTTYYQLSLEEVYNQLYRRLTNQPYTRKPPLGNIRRMPTPTVGDLTTKAA